MHPQLKQRPVACSSLSRPIGPWLQLPIILKRQANREGGANAWRAVHFERTVVVLDDFFCNVEPEASSALALFGREIGIENLVNPSRGDPVTIVFHAKVHIEILPCATDRNRSFLARTSLHRVNDHVLDGTFDLDGVPEKNA